MALSGLRWHPRTMLLAYLALVVASGAVASVRPSCTAALMVWYMLLLGGGFHVVWWPLAGLAAHVLIGPTVVVMLRAE